MDLFGGLSYVNFGINGLASRQTANGWDASVNGTLLKYVSAEADISGSYFKTQAEPNFSFPAHGIVNISMSNYSLLGGPRLNIRPIFIHALVGSDRLSGRASQVGFVASQYSLASALGGGVQWKLSAAWSLRLSGDYLLTRQNIFGGSRSPQNDFRASVGIVLNFGKTLQSPRLGRARVTSPVQDLPRLDEAASLGIKGYPTEHGCYVTEVTSGSAASRAGITSDDTVVSVDGLQIHSAREIEAAIAKSASGRIKVVFLVKGIWTLEREAQVR